MLDSIPPGGVSQAQLWMKMKPLSVLQFKNYWHICGEQVSIIDLKLAEFNSSWEHVGLCAGMKMLNDFQVALGHNNPIEETRAHGVVRIITENGDIYE